MRVDAVFACVCVLAQAVPTSSSSATCILLVRIVVVAVQGLYGHVHVTMHRLSGCVSTVGYTMLSARIVVSHVLEHVAHVVLECVAHVVLACVKTGDT